MMMHPHGFCLLWDGPLVGAHVIGDAAVAMAYFLIPVVLWGIRSLFNWPIARNLMSLFGIFIISCGLTHVMDIVVLWYPLYWLQAIVKLITAAASLGTFFYLFTVVRVGHVNVAAILHTRRHDDRPAAS